VVDLSQSTTSTVLVVALGVALLSLATAVAAHLRLAGITRRYRVLWAGGRRDASALLSEQADELAHLRRDLERVTAQLSATLDDIAQSLRHVAVVRYDAFGDLGGRLSFSAAVVDDRGDGLVLSSIHARRESRTYAKGVVRGDSQVTLTPEEQQALAAARTGRGTP
jgi:hypothetical protein